jgi:FMN phosphatase YigB (HAD superfamily)
MNDIKGCRAAVFGFVVVWLDRHGQSEDRLPGRATVRFTSLGDLLPLLGIES